MQGVSGALKFDSRGDPMRLQQVHQWQEGKYVLVLSWYPGTDVLTENNPVRWTGGYVPRDGVKLQYKHLRTKSSTYVACCVVASIGIVMSISFLIFNIAKRRIRQIKMSSPKINNVILLGCIIITYSSIFFEPTGDMAHSELLVHCKVGIR